MKRGAASLLRWRCGSRLGGRASSPRRAPSAAPERRLRRGVSLDASAVVAPAATDLSLARPRPVPEGPGLGDPEASCSAPSLADDVGLPRRLLLEGAEEAAGPGTFPPAAGSPRCSADGRASCGALDVAPAYDTITAIATTRRSRLRRARLRLHAFTLCRSPRAWFGSRCASVEARERHLERFSIPFQQRPPRRSSALRERRTDSAVASGGRCLARARHVHVRTRQAAAGCHPAGADQFQGAPAAHRPSSPRRPKRRGVPPNFSHTSACMAGGADTAQVRTLSYWSGSKGAVLEAVRPRSSRRRRAVGRPPAARRLLVVRRCPARAGKLLLPRRTRRESVFRSSPMRTRTIPGRREDTHPLAEEPDELSRSTDTSRGDRVFFKSLQASEAIRPMHGVPPSTEIRCAVRTRSSFKRTSASPMEQHQSTRLAAQVPTAPVEAHPDGPKSSARMFHPVEGLHVADHRSPSTHESAGDPGLS